MSRLFLLSLALLLIPPHAAPAAEPGTRPGTTPAAGAASKAASCECVTCACPSPRDCGCTAKRAADLPAGKRWYPLTGEHVGYLAYGSLDAAGRVVTEWHCRVGSNEVRPGPAPERQWVNDTSHPGWQGWGWIEDGQLVGVQRYRLAPPNVAGPSAPAINQFVRPGIYGDPYAHAPTYFFPAAPPSFYGGCATGNCPR